jgi:hypothetical protein
MRVCDPEACANSEANFESLAAEGARPWKSGHRRCYSPAEFVAALRAVRDSHGPATGAGDSDSRPGDGAIRRSGPIPTPNAMKA